MTKSEAAQESSTEWRGTDIEPHTTGRPEFDPQHQSEKPAAATHICNFRYWLGLDSKGNGAAGQPAWLKQKVSSRFSEGCGVLQEDAWCCSTDSASMCVSAAVHLCIQTTNETVTSESGTWSL